MPSLTRAEAVARTALLTVESYEVDLDLTTGAEVFRSTTTVRFRAAAGADTFVELKPARLRSAALNGTALDPAGLAENRLPLGGLVAENELVVVADMAYSNTGEGLHRFTDPVDGETYLYAMSFLDEGQRIFACFDQPDLKAPVRLRVTADPRWTVTGNGAATQVSPGRWECATTPALATYFVTLLAGPYHVARAEHDGIPLALYCRASLAEHLDRDAEELFAVTRACLDRFHVLFGVRYPFGKYDQAFVPEFNAGAMENPGCVTFRDDYMFRSRPSEAEREARAVTIAHEMAHMWFGDLVTMRWWDDLWLNESFAEYLGTRVTAEVTEFRAAWTSFAIKRKLWGYAADQRPSTHPVAPTEVVDSAHALLNFDGISYAKGASVLRQLVAWVGDEPFLAGLRAHVAGHAFGNASLADLLAALSEASGRDLSGWAELWLRRAQVNTLEPEIEVDGDRRYRSAAVVQSAPEGYPTLRPHRLGIGRYDVANGVATARPPIEVDVAGEHTYVPALVGEPVADLLLLNDRDLTFAKVRLDDASRAGVPAVLPVLADPLARALVWGAVIDAVRDAQLPAADLVALVGSALPAETSPIVVENVLATARDLADRYLPPADRADGLARLAEACAGLLATTVPDDPRRIPAARALVRNTVDVELLRGWLAGAGVPAGVPADDELRWRTVYRLVALGAAGPAEIDQQLAADRSATGEQWATRCRAATPDPAVKEAAWRALIEDTSISNRLVEATAEGFWHPEQAALTGAYVERYFADMPDMAARRTPWVTERAAESAYPRFAVAPATRAAAADLLGRADLDPGLRRAVVDADDELGRALAARAAVAGR
ncbi:MAG TPA: aminopeptidase N [Micromonosporaceae bacterium]|nr:aminopeptidase N [Micromonosporaceae bacterium]